MLKLVVRTTQLINTQRRKQEQIFNRKQRCGSGIENKN